MTATIPVTALVVTCLGLLAACASHTQGADGVLQPASGVTPGPAAKAGQSGAARQGNEERLYDPATVQTVRGTIAEVEYAPSMRSDALGFHVILQTASERLVVHLGPSWYIEQQAVEFEPGSSLQVTGSRLTLSGRQVILARSVLVDAKPLTLRDSSGLPAWTKSKPADVR